MARVDTEIHYTTAEAAEILGVDSETVRRYCANLSEGKTPAIPATRVGRSWFIHPKDLEKFAKARRQAGRPASNS